MSLGSRCAQKHSSAGAIAVYGVYMTVVTESPAAFPALSRTFSVNTKVPGPGVVKPGATVCQSANDHLTSAPSDAIAPHSVQVPAHAYVSLPNPPVCTGLDARGRYTGPIVIDACPVTVAATSSVAVNVTTLLPLLEGVTVPDHDH